MNRARFCLPGVLLLAAFCATSSPLGGPALAQERGNDKAVRPAPKWEYKALTREQIWELGRNAGERTLEGWLTAGLNELGADGWELVAIDVYSDRSRRNTYVFKRQK